MSELRPDEFEKMLNSDGEIVSDKLSEEQKKTLMFAKLLRHPRGASAGIRCFSCGGSGFQKGSNFTCYACNGRGWK